MQHSVINHGRTSLRRYRENVVFRQGNKHTSQLLYAKPGEKGLRYNEKQRCKSWLLLSCRTKEIGSILSIFNGVMHCLRLNSGHAGTHINRQ